MSDAKLLHVSRWRDHGGFDDVERLALEYAERITITDQDVDDAFHARLREQFTEPALVELTAMIGFENFSSKFNHAFLIGGQQFCPLPPPSDRGDA